MRGETASFGLTDVVEQNLQIEVGLPLVEWAAVYVRRDACRWDLLYYVRCNDSVSFAQHAIGANAPPFITFNQDK